MECPTEDDFAFVKVQTYSGHVHAQALRVETIQTERAGKHKNALTDDPKKDAHVTRKNTTLCTCRIRHCEMAPRVLHTQYFGKASVCSCRVCP